MEESILKMLSIPTLGTCVYFCKIDIKNKRNSYGLVSMLLHWVMAILQIRLFSIGL